MDRDELIEFIEIAEQQKIKKLSLANKDITELPPEIGRLTQLVSLDLSYNMLENLPKEFSKLSKLKTLYLYHNEFAKLPPLIGDLTSLTLLDLSNNKLTDLPHTIGHLINLKSLDIGYNHMKVLPLEFINLTSLKKLYLENNDFVYPPAKVVKRGLYATMHFLFGELRKRDAAKVIVQVYNMPQELLTPFKQYLGCFNDLVSAANGQDIEFDVKFIKQDLSTEITIKVEVENYIYEFLDFIKDVISNKKYELGEGESKIFDMQVIELREQMTNLNSSLDTKMNEIKILQERMKSFNEIVEKKAFNPKEENEKDEKEEEDNND